MKRIVLVAGARPNFMKIAPIIEEIQKVNSSGADIEYALVHTGQHYDSKMSGSFFTELDIPEPDINLAAGGGTQAEQTAAIMVAFEKYLSTHPCALVLVVGDVTSTLACAIVSKKLNIPVAHVEGGIRSGDLAMPEEINRLVTDSICDYFFTTSKMANENLMREGKKESQLYFVGNTMIDTLLRNIDRLKKPEIWSIYDLSENNYFVVTLHRPSNVDDREQMKAIFEILSVVTNGLPIIFPVHPRTKKNMEAFNIQPKGLHLTDAMGYLEFNYLVKNAKGVITDSGGITEETTVMGIPCLTLRTTTERPETITIGTNKLIGDNPQDLVVPLNKIMKGEWKKGGIPELWDGKAAERIVTHLVEILNS
jgi:UDP-N-acetylglucosamine 2-epimerase (non-hydrolysing)